MRLETQNTGETMMIPSQIRVVIADSQPVVLFGLRAMLTSASDICLIGEAEDGVDAVDMVTTLNPDVVIVDLRMRCLSGFEIIRSLRHNSPQTHILVFTANDDEESIFFSINLGVTGYLLKDATDEMVIHAIRSVYGGETTLHPKVARKVMQRLAAAESRALRRLQLTEREIEVLILVARGYENQRIADELHISARTARTHVSNILEKLGLTNRTQATLYALRMGLLRLEMVVPPPTLGA